MGIRARPVCVAPPYRADVQDVWQGGESGFIFVLRKNSTIARAANESEGLVGLSCDAGLFRIPCVPMPCWVVRPVPPPFPQLGWTDPERRWAGLESLPLNLSLLVPWAVGGKARGKGPFSGYLSGPISPEVWCFSQKPPRVPHPGPRLRRLKVREGMLAEAEGRAVSHLPFPLGQTHDVRTFPRSVNPSKASPFLSLRIPWPRQGCAEWGASRGHVGLQKSLRR